MPSIIPCFHISFNHISIAPGKIQPLITIETMFTLTCWNIPRYQAGSELVRQTWERLKYDTEQTEGRGHCMGLIFSFQLMSGWKNFSTLLCLFSSQSPVLLFQLLHLLLCLALQPKYFLKNESNMELFICGTRDAYHLLLSRLPFFLLLGQCCHLLLIVLAQLVLLQVGLQSGNIG